MNRHKDSIDFGTVITTEVDALAGLLRALPDRGELALTVTGESMVPFYRHGCTTVILRREVRRSHRRGDAVFFLRTDGTPVLHRILCVRRESLTVGGDGQRFTESISAEQILARVVRVRRSPEAREVSVDGVGYRLLVWLWSRGRWWHPRVAKWYRKRERGVRHGFG